MNTNRLEMLSSKTDFRKSFPVFKISGLTDGHFLPIILSGDR